jgi:hypothetical protein
LRHRRCGRLPQRRRHGHNRGSISVRKSAATRSRHENRSWHRRSNHRGSRSNAGSPPCLAFNATERTLQRLFQRYVGASPRWVIKRYRAYEALDHLHDARPLQLAALAQHLGYFDQAHFANDFKSYIGRAPSEYAEYALGLKVRASAGS